MTILDFFTIASVLKLSDIYSWYIVSNKMPNIFSVDIEDWFFLPDNQALIDPVKISRYIDNFVKNVNEILSILKEKNIRATFFILGKVAQELPDLIRVIYNAGHEIACHGFYHKRIFSISEAEFRQDVEKSVEAIVKSCGVNPVGFRAPDFSITKNSLWALNILAEYGFRYDSSIYPISVHPKYGIKNFELDPFVHDSGIIEAPMSCAEIFGLRIPCSGGGYFRHYPYRLFRFLFRKCNRQGRNVIFYIHPWELGSSYPKENIAVLSRIRRFNNIEKTLPRLKKLLDEFEFISFREFINKGFL